MGIRETLEKVRFAELFNEALWNAAFKTPEENPARRQPYPYSRLIARSNLSQEFSAELQPAFLRTISLLRAEHFCEYSNPKEIRFYLHAFNPLSVARLLVGGTTNESDLRYLYMRSLRERHQLRLNSRMAETFSLFADAANRVLEQKRRVGQQEERRGIAIDFTSTLLASLKQAWSVRGSEAGIADSELAAFVQTCRVVNYFQPHHHPGKVLINTRRIDSEYLLSNLFGLSTSMPGFDDLFGGGGIMLTDGLGNQSGIGVDGRKVLVVGRYGSGKSLLSLQMAVEVARKGGAAWVMSLEQPAEECLYALAAVGQYPDRRFVRIETNPVDAALALKEEKDRGLLLFVDNIKDPFESFLESLTQNATLLAKYGDKYLLRLIVVDPINAVFRKRETLVELRDKTLKSLDEVVKNNTNVWIVSEDEGEEELSFAFEQNIADTVIKLRNTRSHDYSMRFIEISKSRMQREQRGWHPISIKPEGGILVAPAPAAVAARIRPRSTLRTGQYVEFGVPGMEDILSRKGLAAGDVAIIRGPQGNLKTQLGQSFLFSSDLRPEQIKRTSPRSLLVAIGEDADKIRADLEQTYSRLPVALRRKTLGDILVLSIPKGYIQPGFVLQLIENHLIDARRQDCMIDRVTVDNVRNWILSCPFLREDATFGDTLVELFRKYGVTSCFVCSEAATDHDSALREMIISNADCEIRLLSHNFKGSAKSIVRVSKTRDMAHRRELFELSVRDGGILVQPISSLLRLDNDGVIRPVTIRLFLHAETLGQQQYNERIRDAIQSTLSPATHLTEQSRVFLSSNASLGKSAAVDELQLVQLDEFQMPTVSNANDGSIQLARFSDDLWTEQCWGGMLEVLEARVRRKGGSFIGLPFFCNIGMLAYRHAKISKEAVEDWALLAKECESWQQQNDESQLFFDFPAGTDENYNCLFWEILLSRIHRDRLKASDCALMRLLTTSEAVDAALIMRSLGRRAHLRKQISTKADNTLRDLVSTNTGALVWRHWYTTLNDMLANVDEKNRRDITVTLLPKKVCVAGEWFVAIPQYSAASSNGLDLIRILTSTEAELDRMVRGIGLPTRSGFYYADDTQPMSGVLSPFFRLEKKEVGDRIRTAFRRSQFSCYSLLSGVLATHIKQILEVPELSLDELRKETGSILGSLVDTFRFVQSRGADSTCISCGAHRAKTDQP